MITEIIISAQAEDVYAARKEINDVISRIMSATMIVNHRGEWKLRIETTNEPLLKDKLRFVTQAHDFFPATEDDNADA